MNIDEDILNFIYNIPWFEKCGVSTELTLIYGYEFIELAEVKTSLLETEWDNLENDEFNNLFDWFKTSSICLDWERTVREIRENEMPKIDNLIVKKVKIKFGNNSKLIMDSIHYDVLMIIMKLIINKKFSSDSEPKFFNELLKVYQRGNFPCGWHGKYPHGKLLIY